MATKRGPFTIDELLVYWRAGVVDDLYAQPLVERVDPGLSVDADEDLPTGANQDQGGLEIYTQQMAQAVRTSEAIDRSMQALFILPHSGQSDEPASGGARAVLTVEVSRAAPLDRSTILDAGFVVEEVQVDASPDGSLEVRTERRYRLDERVSFHPGETGPVTVQATATVEGYGHNNPEPGSVRGIFQPGVGLQNEGASVVTGTTTDRLLVAPDADVVVPQNVGQYVQLNLGPNDGRILRAVGYEPPQPGVHGGVLSLARVALLRIGAVAGEFQAGEDLLQVSTGATGTFVSNSTSHLVAEAASATWAGGFVVTGQLSGATALVTAVDEEAGLVDNAGGTNWKVLAWEELGVSVTNPSSPAGGRAATLDEIGAGRNIPRSPGEGDDSYRRRIATLPDTVSPNAIRRAANRLLAPLGASACLREVGGPLLRGMFYDGDSTSADPAVAFAYDLDSELRPADRHKVWLDYERFRGYFEVGVPRIGVGDFGLAYDAGPSNAYDASPFPNGFDGFPTDAAILYRGVWQAVDKARAFGVGFDLIPEDGTCE